MELSLTEPDRIQLGRWRIGRRPVMEWLATGPPPARVQAMLVRALDRDGPQAVLGRVLGAHLDVDPVRIFSENWPRKAARLAAECRARGDSPHAGQLEGALVELMHCAACGRPLEDPRSIGRGIGPDCWQSIDPAWRAGIEARLSTEKAVA